ncbi:MAG: two-component system, OmpR family, response regulator CssR [Halanaerobiales bacterium]|nr:two-component system, OmpR family, response regulator CssR [Halanaerobiales bacterium]
MSFKIYLVEDDENLNRLLTSYLENEGWQVKSFLTGVKAKKAIVDKPHLWILDIMLPDIDGYQLITEIKEDDPHLPVIFISARDADLDRIIGLEKGSDDYLAKPFSPRELVIRTRKLLERIYKGHDKEEKTILYNQYKIALSKRAVFTSEGEIIELTSLEFELLTYLLRNLQQALSREQILTAVWGDNYFGTDRVVDDLIRRLRKKLPLLNIETIYGYGYKLVNPYASFEE